MVNWLKAVVKLTKNSYIEVFSDTPPEVTIVPKEKWESELEHKGISVRDKPAVYVIDHIYIRDDATYFDVLHEFGHDALYGTLGVKGTLLDAKKLKNTEEIKKLESKFSLEFIESSADQYAQIIGYKSKEKLPQLIKDFFKNVDVNFMVLNGTTYQTGWGNDMDVWVISGNLADVKQIELPKELDVETVPLSFFEEGVERSDGIYSDFVNNGKILLDTNNFEARIKASEDKPVEQGDVDYHFRMAYYLLSLAEARIYQLKHQVRRGIINENNLYQVRSGELNLPRSQLCLNPLSYAVSYAYLGGEYAKGKKVILSKENIPTLDTIRLISKQSIFSPEFVLDVVRGFVNYRYDESLKVGVIGS